MWKYEVNEGRVGFRLKRSEQNYSGGDYEKRLENTVLSRERRRDQGIMGNNS